jgi:hypothetical protein
MAGKNFPEFRKAKPAACENSYQYERMIVSASVVEMASRPRRNQRLFWRHEFAPSPGIPRSPQFLLPEFFHSFREG